MAFTSSVWKPNFVIPPSKCHVQHICRTFSSHWHKSSDDYVFSFLRKCDLHFIKKQKFVEHIAHSRKIIIACKKMFTAINRFKQHLARGRRHLIMCAAMPFTFDWYNERICFDELVRLCQEFEVIEKLVEKSSSSEIFKKFQNSSSNTVDKKPKLITQSLNQTSEKMLQSNKLLNDPNSLVCTCDCSRCKNMNDGWEPFSSSENFKAWKKINVDYPDQKLYIYKVHGHFDDVTPLDFMQVQLDLEYRKEWDSMSVDLEILDSEPLTCSDLIYWELRWPKWFQNRDYVFKRRYMIDEKEKTMCIVCESTEHPQYPEFSGKWRVKNYWSYIVIKPKYDFDKAGVEFSITYFDDPGVTVSNYLTSWYQSKGMPSFLNDQRMAALELARRRTELNNTTVSDKIRVDTPVELPQKQTQSWMSWLFGYSLF
ncbi:stAR-related lipid transfer protein 7, mitochondrial isoform X2 [Adelges cooleyi]|uniref:stAR-related lipid transfer protein 7, mitochondrial isoform X2 n=1 Tax=Adelges cooleyi TaxID=133065 RepID=UPI00217F3E74|nr:stAR-related lipid transfer protein 7, mitochondrial isoform X2 [Adelges cooleyi]